jgi:hypothetical protein
VAANGLPRPAIDHKPDVYDQQVCRDLFSTYGVTITTSGSPLASRAAEDRETMMQLWAQVRIETQ